MPTVTIFPNAKNPTDAQYLDSAAVVEQIRIGQWKSLIDKLNSFEIDSKQQKSFKESKIPGIIWQGTFTERKNDAQTEHSGLVAIDLDGMPEDVLVKYKDILSQDPYSYAVFISPRRNGLKIITKIPPSIPDHRLYVNGLRKHYFCKYYDHFEDPARLCFVSYDPDIYFNPDSEVWTVKDTSKSKSSKPPTQHIPEDITGTFNRLRSWCDRSQGYTDGNKHKHLVSLFSACNRFGIPRDQAVAMAYSTYSDTPNTEPVAIEDYQDRANSVYTLYSGSFATQRFDDPEPQHTPEPEPVSVAGTFPIDVFPTDVQSLINELNSSLNYSRDFLSAAMMFAIATLNGNKYKLRVKNGWDAPTIFWFAIVGEPGTMKSHPISTILSPLNELDRKSKHLWDESIREWEYQKSLDKKSNPGPKPGFKQILISDITLESIHEVHGFNKRGLGHYKDELIGFINNMNQYRKGGDEQFWLESFNNQPYLVNRVTKDPNLIEDTMINIIGTIQPSVLSRITQDYAGNGLTDRFLYTGAERNIYQLCERDIDPAWLKWWRDKLTQANSMFAYLDKLDTIVINMNPGALTRLIEIDGWICNLQRSDTISGSLKNYLSKAKTYIPRFALLMGLFDTVFTGVDVEVGVDHIDRAFKIMKYFVNSSTVIFNEAKKVNEIKEVSSTKKGMTTPEKVNHLLKNGFSKSDIAKELNLSRAYIYKITS